MPPSLSYCVHIHLHDFPPWKGKHERRRQARLGGVGYKHMQACGVACGALHTSFRLTPLRRTSSMSRKVELFASTFRDSLWLQNNKLM